MEEARFLAAIEDAQAMAELVAELGLPRQALHAAELRLVHPGTGEPCRLSAPWPPDLQWVLPTRAVP